MKAFVSRDGVIGFSVTVGLWWRWRERFDWPKAAIIALLLLFVYLSHLISFAMLAGVLVLLGVVRWRESSAKTLGWTLAAIVPAVPLAVWYVSLGRSNDRLAPVWNHVADPLAPGQWLLQWRASDPFQLLSRKALPFVEEPSAIYAIFTPTLWLLAAVGALLLATIWHWKRHGTGEKRGGLIWLALAGAMCTIWLFAPDSFGKSHGAFLRERILLLGLICLAPALRLQENAPLKRLAQVMLLFVIVFQSAVLWDYARRSDRLAREIWPAREVIAPHESLASIIVNRDGCQFKPIPRGQLTALFMIGRNGPLWDNYELGYYLFPVVARRAEDRRFIYEFRESNTYDFCDPGERADDKLRRLSEQLALNRERIDVLLVWGRDERLENLAAEWFENAPFFENGEVRLYRRRNGRPNQ